MGETHKVFDPFKGEVAEISDKLTDRLRGRYAVGPMLPTGEPEFGWRQMGDPTPIMKEAAAELERQQWINRRLFGALKNITEFWCYGLAKPNGAKPSDDDERRVEEIAVECINALNAADPTYIYQREPTTAELIRKPSIDTPSSRQG